MKKPLISQRNKRFIYSANRGNSRNVFNSKSILFKCVDIFIGCIVNVFNEISLLNKLRYFYILFIACLLSMQSCLKNGTTTLPEPVKRPTDISNPVEVHDELTILNNLTESDVKYNNNLIDTSLVIYGYQRKITTSNGGSVYLPFYTNRAFKKLSVRVKGCESIIDQAFIVDDTSGRVHFTYKMPLTIVQAGNIWIEYWVTDSSGHVSNMAETEIEVLKLGQGTLQISFSWDNTSDLDLWVFEPSQEKIYYVHRESKTGGVLDRDDIDGFGPENIYWTTKPPEGKYIVKANLFSYRQGDELSQYTININFKDTNKTFIGKLSPMNRLNEVATFEIKKSSILFKK